VHSEYHFGVHVKVGIFRTALATMDTRLYF
jgi:hypothetical protein